LDFNYSLFFIRSKLQLKKFKTFFDEEVVENPLNYRQRISVIVDEKRNLIVAGAGTGKTTTILAKVMYLLKNKKCTEDEILTLAFSNAAKKELEERLISKGFSKVKVKTIHALGLEVLKLSGFNKKVTTFSGNNSLDTFISHLILKIPKKTNLSKAVARFFSDYLVPFYDLNNFKTPKEYQTYVNMSSLVTLNEDWVKSYGEYRIGNFLFSQGVSHEYENEYQTLNERKIDFYYQPDFHISGSNIYIEYFGIDKDGKTAPWIDSKKYNREITSKRNIHREYGTELIEITYQDIKDDVWKEKLIKEFRRLNVKRAPKTVDEIIDKVRLIREGKVFNKLAKLLSQFLIHFKSRSLDIDKLIDENKDDMRTVSFLYLFKYIHKEYQKNLEKNKSIDFMDMLNLSTNLVKSGEYKNTWKYIIVDEFQDTSFAQYEFLNQMLAQNEETKMFCVGDDWQSIYSFSGADVHYMTDYKYYFGVANIWSKITGRKENATLISLNETFRFDNMMAHTSSKFIQKNPAQIKKDLITNKSKENNTPSVYLHWGSNLFDKSLKEWVDTFAKKKIYKNKNLLILARYNHDFRGLTKETRDYVKEKWSINGHVNYLTCHGAKGMEEDVVLIINLTADFLGFPSNVIDDQLLSLVRIKKEEDYAHAEERRLFYVAITRARYETHILCDLINPSIFAEEIKGEDYLTQSFYNNQDLYLCPECKDGFVINHTKDLSKRNFYKCSNPICEYIGPTCECGGLITRDNEKVRCRNKDCKIKQSRCTNCNDGIMELLINKDDNSEYLRCHRRQLCKNRKIN